MGRKVQWSSRIVAMLVMIASATLASCEQKRHIVGSVNTEFKLIGLDHKIILESYDDPKVDGITVFISKSQGEGSKARSGWRRIHPTLPSPCARPVPSK